MSQSVQVTADRALNRAISTDEQANACYYQILKRFVTTKSALAEEKPRQPEARLDADGLKHISAAWLVLQDTQKKLRKAYMNLYTASL
ncbi:hypothetical protein ACFLXP_05590 [Chloroflexota bacterium]